MLSDESSSDSETGRFKGRSKDHKEQSSNQKQDNSRNVGRSRPSDDRYRRDTDRRRDERDRYDRRSRERYRSSRHQSPVRRRQSRERSPPRRSRESHRYSRDSRPGSKSRDHRSTSRDTRKRSTSQKPSEPKKEVKEESKQSTVNHAKSPITLDRKSREPSPSSLETKTKRSVILKPEQVEAKRGKSDSPIIVVEHDSDASAEVQPGSYYNMIPAVVKEKSDESSEIDSSDDERLRAKLLNLERELHKTKKKKHKKKHKKRSSKNKDKDDELSTSVEVSSTTDIQDTVTNEVACSHHEAAEVTSTQKSVQKESSEEGEISSDNDSQDLYDIDPTDLRHKLRRGKRDSSQDTAKSKVDVCGPALPPHLKARSSKSNSPDIEGPVLPPHLQRKVKIGPSIPEDMRKKLADGDPTEILSSEEEGIGPLPAGAEEKWSDAHQRLEERALDIKIKKLDGHSLSSREVKSREQWMLELPEGKAKYLGLEARSFRAKEGPDMSDRSSWTDTPEDKARKAAGLEKSEDVDAALKREIHARIVADRDEEQESAVKKHKKKHKRDESLLEMHEKKLKKKKKKEERADAKKERRPFSRDVDLQVNRFDEAQKRSIIKKAEALDTRFSSGEAKFL